MPSDGARIGAILLAAGSSSRLGQPKQLLPWQGQTLLRHAATVALESGVSPVIVVLGSHADEMTPELEGLAVHIILHSNWAEGMGSSLRAGFQALEELAATEAVLVLLSDQPLITAEHLRALVEQHRLCPLVAVASQYADGVLGPPCLLSHTLYPKLRELSGAHGARAILGKLPAERISVVPFPEAMVDVDTPADWERVKESSYE